MSALPTRVAYIVACLAPISVVGVLASNVGAGNGMIYSIAFMFFVPFAIGAALAWAVRGKPFSSWIVLLGIMVISIYGFVGLHSAFFRVPARGAIDLIYRPIEQSVLMVGVAVFLAVPILIGKLRNRKYLKR
jgi:hypothetical protein